MKKILTLSVLMIFGIIYLANAQVPQKMSYQAVIRNSSNTLVVSHMVGMKISILQGSASGTEVYSETQTPTTNANGLVSIEIGNGVGFSTINWSLGPYFMKTETDPTGGTNYTITGTSQLLSVPYSLSAKTAETADYNNLSNLPALNIANWNTAYSWGNHATAGYLTSFTETDPLFSAHLSSHITGADTSNWNHKFNLPVLTSGSLLFSNGTSIAQDNNNLYWNNTSKRLGIGTNVPEVQFEIKNNSGNNSITIFKVLNNNGDSVLIVSGNSTNIYLDSTTGSFSIFQLVNSQKNQLFRVNPSNCFIGYKSGAYIGTGKNNFFAGNEAGRSCINGSENVYIGYKAGQNNEGSGNVFIGSNAGGGSTASSNRLYISNSNTVNPLIYGEFDNRKIIFNGSANGIETTPSSDIPGLYGEHNVTAYYGIGVKGIGAYKGVHGESTLSGTGNRYGVYGTAGNGGNNFGGRFSGYSGTEAYGIYCSASGATTNYAGYFSGNVVVTGTFTNPSDKNLKENIKPITGALDKILNINGVTFEWKPENELKQYNTKNKMMKENDEAFSFNFPSGTQYGVIAQDVEKVIPELVSTDGDGLKSVDYVKMIPILIEAIKEQQKKIESLELLQDKVTQLEEQNEKLMNELEMKKGNEK